MRGKETNVAKIHDILHSYRLGGCNIKQTVRDTGVPRGTVRKYVRWAEAKGFLDALVLPSEDDLGLAWTADQSGRDAPPSYVALEPLRAVITEWLDKGLTITRIADLLRERHGFDGSYESLKRFTWPLRSRMDVCTRIEVEAGSQAQVDFGYAGFIWDDEQKRNRKAWLFLMTLSHSRHAYGELVFSQDTETWIGCHRRAFEFFGGVPKKVIIDNLKAAVIKAAIHDPLVNRTYREFACHYDFIISPCKVATPEHKGKVERGIQYVRNGFIKGASFRDINDSNDQLKVWLLETAGLRIHGTTKKEPLRVFEMTEKAALKPLPQTSYIISRWANAELRRDCHVTIEGSYYSSPHKLRGLNLLVQISEAVVRIFHEHKLVATHIRASEKGTRRTIYAHYPPEMVAYLEQTPQWCLFRAKEIGGSTHQFIDDIFHRQHPLDGLKKAQGILSFAKKYGIERVEAACKRALHFGSFTYQSIKNILEKNLDQMPIPDDVTTATLPMERCYEFARPVEEFLSINPKEDTTWN